MIKQVVIIPTYNEIENIDAISRAVLVLPSKFDLLVVDDGSPDGTAAAVKKLMLEYPERVHLLERAEKSGLGKAYVAGFTWALEKGYDYMLEMDADFSHPPAQLEDLLKACAQGGAEVSVGSRYIKGGGVKNWPFDRLFLSKSASLYVRMITGMNVQDPTAGFVCYSRTFLSQLNLDRIRFVGYAFQIEMKYSAHLLGFKIVEIPIIFSDREKGQSKMSGSIIKEAVWGVLTMRFSRTKSEYKM